MRKSAVFPLILSGGASSRLFPFNKVLSDLTGSGQTLIQQAMARAQKLGPRRNVRLLAIRDMAAPIARQLRLPMERVWSDPLRRGTWPAILWALARLRAAGGSSVVAVITGDHVIGDTDAFVQSATRAMTLAREHPALVLLGIRPSDDAETWRGFGCFR